MAEPTPQAVPAPVARVGEAVAIAGLGKLIDLAIDRYKARRDAIKELREKVATLEGEIKALKARKADG